MSGTINMKKRHYETETGAFTNFFPEEPPSAVLRHQVRTWMAELQFSVEEEDEYLAFQMGPSFAAIFFIRCPLPVALSPVSVFRRMHSGAMGPSF
jgi:hypothetical protein